MKKSIVVLSLLAFSVTAAIAANRAPIKQPSAAYKQLQLAIKEETRNYLRGDGMMEKYLPSKQQSASTKALTDDDVGDANSFGRNVIFAGSVQSGVLQIAPDCTPDPEFPLGPNDHCVVPDVNGFVSVNFPDMGHVLIPGKTVKTLLCHWQTPFATLLYQNPTGVYQGTARASFNANYKVENEVLSDPALIDPSTGLPFGGSFVITLTSISDTRGLQPGDFQTYSDNDTRVCNGGLISKRALMESYGLSDAQATKFFKKDTIITMGLSGSSRRVSDGSVIIGTRFVGD
ncbi:MAG: hypothetical protein ABI644_10475 [Arenimonas sp.]